jgi:hypothetical protein
MAGEDFAQGAFQGAWTSALAYRFNDLMHDVLEGFSEFGRTATRIPDALGEAWDSWWDEGMDAVFSEEAGDAFLSAGKIVGGTKLALAGTIGGGYFVAGGGLAATGKLAVDGMLFSGEMAATGAYATINGVRVLIYRISPYSKQIITFAESANPGQLPPHFNRTGVIGYTVGFIVESLFK